MANLESIERSHFGVINEALRGGAAPTGFNWGAVRNFGELHLLSRASYLMLILVPLLAGLWPAVTTAINQYNQLLSSAAEKIEVASEKLDWYRGRMPEAEQLKPVKESLSSLHKEIELIRNHLEERSIKRKTLPKIWALSFLASLLAIVAQVIYQMSAPRMVKSSSMREYINSIIDDELKIQGDNKQVDTNQIQSLISRSAIEYHNASRANIGAAISSMFFYCLAVLVIVYIIFDQSLSVFKATGWL